MGIKPVTGWAVPTVLFAACVIPTTFGIIRMHDILRDGDFALNFLRDHVDRLPLFVHALGGIVFLILGTLQVLTGPRRRNPHRHRVLGRLAIPMGLLGALSGLWMTLLHPDISSPLLYWGRIGSSLIWAGAIILALAAIRARDFAAHGVWMIRAYAVALPAGTLSFIMLPIYLVFGEEGNELLFEAVQVLAWPLHLLVAEMVIRRVVRRPVAGLSGHRPVQRDITQT